MQLNKVDTTVALEDIKDDASNIEAKIRSLWLLIDDTRSDITIMDRIDEMEMVMKKLILDIDTCIARVYTSDIMK